MEWGELAFQVAITIAVVTWIKKLTEDKLGHYYMLISMGIAFAVVFLAMAESFIVLDFVKQSIVVGLSASGVFDVAKRVSGN